MRKTLILSALLAATPFAASAAGEQMSYTYAEGGVTHIRVDNSGDTASDTGAYVRGSFSIAPQVYVFASYWQINDEYRVNGIKVEDDLYSPELGIGYHMPISDRLDFTADAAYVRYENKVKASATIDGVRVTASDKAHSDGGRIDLGLRGKPSARTEAWVKAGYQDISNSQSSWVGTVGGQVNLTRMWGIVGEAKFIDDVSQYSVGVRASF